ncbi:MAG: iron-containing alcohol dehydrogenase [Propionibacteriaceae bacterium]|jgi:alcohol dehydrogenase class IV|nr:iron-containing alcohol dehydrogenase [Propionibacteriaceae bacterium]
MDRFQIKTEIYYGADSMGYLNQLDGKRVVVVTDAFMATTDVMKQVRAALLGAEVTVFDRVKPNPNIEVITDAFMTFAAAKPQALITLGGGSSIDTAKAVHKVAQEQGLADVPFIAIPTTSGSGSEMTSYAVITNELTSTKIAMASDDMYPDVAILDPLAVLTTPPRLTADTGFDAVSHAVESYVSTGHTDFSDAMAEKALHLLFEYLPITYADGKNLEARERVHNAACLAGMAFENAGLGIVHSLSHAIGGTFPAPHGRLNALIMPTVMEFNAGDLRVSGKLSPTAMRYAQLGRMLGATTASTRNQVAGFVALIRHLRQDLEMPERITDLGIPPYEFVAAIPQLAQTALNDRCTATNPREVTVGDLEALLRFLI